MYKTLPFVFAVGCATTFAETAPYMRESVGFKINTDLPDSFNNWRLPLPTEDVTRIVTVYNPLYAPLKVRVVCDNDPYFAGHGRWLTVKPRNTRNMLVTVYKPTAFAHFCSIDEMVVVE